MRFLGYDSPLMQGLNKLGDLLWLNILTLICCIPIVTVGPALTALHYMTLKIVRNEEGYITRSYFQSFKKNLKQGIAVWLILLAVLLVLAGDFYIMNYSGLEFSDVMRVLLTVVFLLVLFTSMFLFPVLAKFENTVLHTIRNAFLIGVMQLPRTILMMVLFALPTVLFIFVPQLIPIVFMFGFSIPAWASAKLYNKFFQKLEDKYYEDNPEEKAQENEEGDKDNRIFKDELDPALQDDTLTD